MNLLTTDLETFCLKDFAQLEFFIERTVIMRQYASECCANLSEYLHETIFVSSIAFDKVFLGICSGRDFTLTERAKEAESSEVYCCYKM